MWCSLPFDLLSIIFSYLSPDSFARAKATCRNWYSASASASASASSLRLRHHPPWFFAFPTRTRAINSCYAHNPLSQTWHRLPLSLPPHLFPIKPIAATHGLILAKSTTTISLRLALTNPFTNQSKSLPNLIVPRTNPAVGLLDYSQQHFKIYVAGGAAPSGAFYHPTIESYDSADDTWTLIGAMPVEFAVRLTVWTPSESVHSTGTLYWMTSARAYSVMGFTLATNTWHKLSVPMADRLEFAALIPRHGGKVGVLGGSNNTGCRVWELEEKTGEWREVGVMPMELEEKLFEEGEEMNWGKVKCVGIERAVCVYREIGLGIVIYRELVAGKWEWEWIQGLSLGGLREMKNVPFKGLLLHPNLCLFDFNCGNN